MDIRITLAVVALLVLGVGVSVAYVSAWDKPQVSLNSEFLLLVGPALTPVVPAGIAVVPGRSRIGSDRGDWLGVIVGSVSLLVVSVGIGIVALTFAI